MKEKAEEYKERHIRLFKEAWRNFLLDDNDANWQRQDKLTQVLFAHKMTSEEIDNIMSKIQQEVSK